MAEHTESPVTVRATAEDGRIMLRFSAPCTGLALSLDEAADLMGKLAHGLTAPTADRAELAASLKAKLDEYAFVYDNPSDDNDAKSIRLRAELHASIDALARSTDAPSEPKDETAWLVEMHDPGKMYPLHYLHLQVRGCQWPSDANDATRFARKQDADDAMAWMRSEDRLNGVHRAIDYRVAEHCWPALATPPAAATSTPCASGEGEALTDDACDKAAAQTLDRVAAAKGIEHAMYVNPGITAHHTLRRELIRAGYALAAAQAPAVPAFLESTEQRDILVAALTAFSRDDRRNKHAREVANELRTAVAQATRTPTASNTEDARSELVRDLAGRLSRATRASEKNDRDWLVSRDDVLAGRAALTQAASTGGAA